MPRRRALSLSRLAYVELVHVLVSNHWSPAVEHVPESPAEVCGTCACRPWEGFTCLACLNTYAAAVNLHAAEFRADEECRRDRQRAIDQTALHRPRRADGSAGYGPLTDADVIHIQKSVRGLKFLASPDFARWVDLGYITFR